MKKVSYFAVFEENKDGVFGVYFPDISVCISFGETLEKAQKKAKEALKLHVYGLEKYGEQLPASSEKLDSNDIKNCIVMPISIYPDLMKYEMNNRRVVGVYHLYLNYPTSRKVLRCNLLYKRGICESKGISLF